MLNILYVKLNIKPLIKFPLKLSMVYLVPLVDGDRRPCAIKLNSKCAFIIERPKPSLAGLISAIYGSGNSCQRLSMMRKSSFLSFGVHGPLLSFAYTTAQAVEQFRGCWNKAGINTGITFNYYLDLRNCKFM